MPKLSAFCRSQNCRVNLALIFTEGLDKNCNYNMHTLSRLRLTLGKFSIKVRLKIAQKNKSYLNFAIQPVEKKIENIVNNSRLLLFCSSLEFSPRAFLLFKACICLHVCFSCIFFFVMFCRRSTQNKPIGKSGQKLLYKKLFV